MLLQSLTRGYVGAPRRGRRYKAIADTPSDDYYHDKDQDGDEGSTSQIRAAWKLFHIGFTMLNCILFLVLIGGIYTLKGNVETEYDSPASHMVEYKATYFEKYGHLTSPFSKKPGRELDQAWHDLLAGMNIKVSREWIEKFGAESVAFADGSGVLSQLGVYHDLHCLKKLKHWNYQSHYHANLTDEQLEEEGYHVEHCLEWLRVAALCRGDTTLTTLHWGGGSDGSRLETEYPIPRQCVDSDRILAWSEDRAVDISEDGLLERP